MIYEFVIFYLLTYRKQYFVLDLARFEGQLCQA